MMGLPAHKLSARIQVAALLLVVGQDQRAALRQETLDTLERESTAGCTRLQGHPFCHPLAANALEAWLERLDPPGQALAA